MTPITLAADRDDFARRLADCKAKLAQTEADARYARSVASELRAELLAFREAAKPFAAVSIPDNWPDPCVLTWREDQGGSIRGNYASISYLSRELSNYGPTIADWRRLAELVEKGVETKGEHS